MSEIVVSLKNINKQYWLSFAKQSLIGNFLSMFRFGKGMAAKRHVCALEGIELNIKRGEAVGIIGENASGKTTILRIISRITVPTTGELEVNGKVAGLLDLGAGFHSELTGRENIYLDAALYGMSRKEIDGAYEKIVEFSGLGDFINAQVKTYSQGMLVRLGFAIAIHVDPDIFLIDDSLAVGDEEFQRKCLKKVFELKEQGKTIIVVSHDLDSISRICERGILLKSGRIVKDDSIHKVIMRYIEAVGDKNSIASIDKGRISVIFNSGKIILLWDGKPITKNFGGYASLQFLDKWIMSWQGKWQVVENTDYSLKVQGLFDKYGVKLELACFLQGERLMNFNLKLEVPTQTSLKKAGFGFMVSEEYNRYLNGQNIEPIQAIDKSAKEWTDIYRTDEYNAPIMLISRDSMPVLNIRFASHEWAGFSLIQNTAEELNARIMQTQISPPQAFALSGEESSIVESSCRLELMSEEDFKGLIHKRIEESTIASGRLKVQLKDNGIQIFFDETELTKSNGLSLGFYHKSRFFDLFAGLWSLTKNASETLSICSSFQEMGLKAECLLQLAEDSLRWNIDIKSEKSIEDHRLITGLYLSEKYRKYFTGVHDYEFPASGEHVEKIDLLAGETDFIGLMAGNDELPSLVFESLQPGMLELQNSGIDSPGRILMQEVVDRSTNGRIVFLETPEQKSGFLIDKKKKHAKSTGLSNDQLRLEFNENNINIYSGESKITVGEGFSSGVYFNGRWYESTQLKKQIRKEGDTLKVLIERRLPRLSELWEISLKAKKIQWITKIQSEEKLSDVHYKAGIVLNSEYGQWAHSFSEGQFDEQTRNSRVVDLDDVNNALLGARSEDCSLPAVFFKRINSITSGVIIQKEEDKCCLHFKLKNAAVINGKGREKLFSGTISLQDERCWRNDLSNHRKEEFSLQTSDGLQLFAANKQIKLQAQGIELTQAKGLAVALLCEDEDIDTNFALWTLKKNSPSKLEVQMDWANSVLRQRWQFELIDDAIQWTVSFDVKKPILYKELLVNVFPQKQFNRWQTIADAGQIDCEGSAGKAVTIFDNRSEILKVFQEGISRESPGLALNLLVDMKKWFLHIYNHERGDGIACGAHYLSDPQGECLDQGTIEIFKAKISLVSDSGSEQIAAPGNHVDAYDLELVKLKVKIEKAKMRLFWADKELTKKLGMFTSFSINGNLIDSTLAKWDVQAAVDNKIKVRLNWSSYFVSQLWEIKLISEHELCWDVRTEINQAGIDRHTAALMLSDNYESYKSDDNQGGCFPDRFKLDVWMNMSKTKDSIEVNSKQSSFPALIFDAAFEKHEFSNMLENSDALHSSRVLRCEMQSPELAGKAGLASSIKINISIQE